MMHSPAISIEPTTCTGCGLCVLACPVDVIRLEPQSGTARVVYARDCQVCYLCEDDCPSGSIKLSHDVSNSRRFSIYDEYAIDIESHLGPR
jgi:NAD-dependent dihydropyrimidine dehydrogenase PreA subunit